MVAAGLLVQRGLVLRSSAIVSHEDARKFQAFERHLNNACRDETTLGDDRSFSDHIMQVSQEVRRVCTKIGDDGAVGECTKGIEAQLASASGYSNDHWPFVIEILQVVCRHVEATYARIDADFSVSIDLSVHENSKSRMTATTQFPETDRAGDRRANVLLHFPEAFERRDYFSLLTLLHHEVFVHAVQTPKMDGPRQIVGDKCFLAEGMMDALSHRLLIEEISSYLGVDLLPYAHEFLARARKMHADRFTADAPSNNEFRVHEARTRGRNVLDQVKEARSTQDAWDWAVRLAMRLNLATLTTEQRRRALMLIESGLKVPEGTLPSMLGIVSGIAEGEDVVALLKL